MISSAARVGSTRRPLHIVRLTSNPQPVRSPYAYGCGTCLKEEANKRSFRLGYPENVTTTCYRNWYVGLPDVPPPLLIASQRAA